MSIHVNSPKSSYIQERRECPICGKHTRIVGYFQHWYGMTWTCMTCGDMWADGEILPRPFKRGWRQENIDHAVECLEQYLEFFQKQHFNELSGEVV